MQRELRRKIPWERHPGSDGVELRRPGAAYGKRQKGESQRQKTGAALSVFRKQNLERNVRSEVQVDDVYTANRKPAL